MLEMRYAQSNLRAGPDSPVRPRSGGKAEGQRGVLGGRPRRRGATGLEA